jgi:hypothetical protein
MIEGNEENKETPKEHELMRKINLEYKDGVGNYVLTDKIKNKINVTIEIKHVVK